MSGARHLYVHLPFCASRCGYCAFVVETGSLAMRDAYLEALLAELRRESGRLGSLETVYLGGGTPTLMRPRRLARLLDALRPRMAEGAEVTIEANPETVDRRALRELRAMGVTRLSVGVQSFRPHLLGALDRAASPQQARDVVGCARAAGFENVSIDLLFGVPGQTPGDLEADLADALALAPEHVSWYELELKPGSALARRGLPAFDEDEGADAYRRIVAGLEDAGYRWYETANYARPGRECRHSLAYWGAADYLGLGIGAVSTVGGRRWRNASGLAVYLAALSQGMEPPRRADVLDNDALRRERWMLGLRLADGLDPAWAGPPDRPEALRRLAAAGLLRAGDGAVALTREGRFVQNAVLHELMEYA
ncbi:MAG TPA: radical SAM family heme chaperone HemW [Miltoncostaeaceae bacterium]|nr:radical SAM family heme chaperone HemW [Miltoncostaeaceae bacterium]